jgi:hypothetical protein
MTRSEMCGVTRPDRFDVFSQTAMLNELTLSVLRLRVSLLTYLAGSALCVSVLGADLPNKISCSSHSIKMQIGTTGAAMGSRITEVIIRNASGTTCRLRLASLNLERYDQDGRRMPITLSLSNRMNAGPVGTSSISLRPGERAGIKIKTENRTGYSQTDRCGTRLAARLGQRTLLKADITSCDERIELAGFEELGP